MTTTTRSPAKTIGLTILGLIVLFAIIIAIIFAAGGARWVTAPFRGAVDAREQTQADGGYRIAAYDQFFDQCAAIQSIEDQIKAMAEVKGLPQGQKETNLLALTNQRNTLIRQYNADAAKADTRGNFLSSDLPYTLDTNAETTSCTA